MPNAPSLAEVEILSQGDEIVQGLTVDSNAAEIAQAVTSNLRIFFRVPSDTWTSFAPFFAKASAASFPFKMLWSTFLTSCIVGVM